MLVSNIQVLSCRGPVQIAYTFVCKELQFVSVECTHHAVMALRLFVLGYSLNEVVAALQIMQAPVFIFFFDLARDVTKHSSLILDLAWSPFLLSL